MYWTAIRARLESLATRGDFSAEWRFAPDSSSRDVWRFRVPDEFGACDDAIDALAAAGESLEAQFRGSRLLPRRIFEVNDSPVEVWLSALRRTGINV